MFRFFLAFCFLKSTDNEIEYVPLADGHSIRIDDAPLLKLDTARQVAFVHIAGEHSLQVEVLLNTVFGAFKFPFVTEFDADHTCLALVRDDQPLRVPLQGVCRVERSGKAEIVDAASVDLLGDVAPPRPASPRLHGWEDVPHIEIADNEWVHFDTFVDFFGLVHF